MKATSFLQDLGDIKQMTLKFLTQKLAVLLALVLAHRSSEPAGLKYFKGKDSPLKEWYWQP